jgi:hypothetical protein
MNELGPVFDWFRAWQLAVYRKVWNRVRQHWTAEKWIRVTDDERNVRFVGLNQPVTMADKVIENARAQGQQLEPQAEEEARRSPFLQQVVGTKNNVAEMDVDITLDTAPATASLQIEQFQALAELAKAGIPIPPQALIKASSIRNKDEILQEMQGGGDEAQGAQAMQKLQMAEQEIQRLTQELQQAQSGVAVEQVRGQNAQGLEAMRAEIAQAMQAQKDAAAQQLQALKDAAAHNREELKALTALALQQMQPPPALGAEVAGNVAAT